MKSKVLRQPRQMRRRVFAKLEPTIAVEAKQDDIDLQLEESGTILSSRSKPKDLERYLNELDVKAMALQEPYSLKSSTRPWLQ